MKEKIKNWLIKYKAEIITITAMVLASCLSHFVHELIHNETALKIFGAIFPVNESSWEHMKLIWYPFLVSGVVFSILRKNWAYLSSFTLGGFLSIVTIIGVFSIYQSFTTIAIVWLDIILVIILFACFTHLSFYFANVEWFKKSFIFWLVVAVLITAGIITLTYVHPSGYIFLDNEELKELFHH